MPMPTDAPIIDLMLSLPLLDLEATYGNLRAAAKDKDSKDFKFPAQYMFKGVPHGWGEGRDPVEVTLEEMDKWSIKQALVGVGPLGGPSAEALKNHPDRFLGNVHVDPNDVMGEVRKIRRLKDEWDIRAVGTFPVGCTPQVPIDSPLYYPIYSTCCELDIPIFVCAGVPGPRLPMKPQLVEQIDQVMYDFPELTFVTRHGCEPWDDLMVKLMLKWPGLHYSTSAFAPKYYPRSIIDYANTRGAHKIMYAGYFPMGLSLERIFSELPRVPFSDRVWPRFLRENALAVFKLN